MRIAIRSLALLLGLALLLAATPVLAAKGHVSTHSSQDDTADEGDDEADELPPDTAAHVPTQRELASLYRLSAAEREAFVAPALPDLSQYTAAQMARKIDRSQRGSAHIASLLNEPGFKSLTTAIGQGLAELAMRQHGTLRAIIVEDGILSLPQLAALLPKDVFAQVEPGVFIARLPLLVRHGATLELGPAVKELRLSQDSGALLAIEGTLYIHDSSVTGWSESKRAPSVFRDKHEFRPFIVAWGGSRTLISGSRIAHLGYASTKAFGLTLSQYSTTVAQRAVWPRPTGWIIDSEISDLWYGFYCWEADDVVLRGNVLRDNIKYGIDPHDRSQRLVIAGNEAYGTRLKHGIIISREVNRSFIVGNKSHDNALSGIVLDRQCRDNLIANNVTYRNASDGIVLSESPHNLVWSNLSSGNTHHGIRLRNSTDVRLQDNSAIANGLAGIYGVARDLSKTDRNFSEDPYQRAMSMDIAGGQLSGNGSGPINLDEPTRVSLDDLDLRKPQRQLGFRFGGVLLAFQIEVLDIVVNRQLVAVLEAQPPPAQPAAAPIPVVLHRHH